MIIKVKTDKKTKVLFNVKFPNLSKVIRKYDKVAYLVDSNVFDSFNGKFAHLANVYVIEDGEGTKTLGQSQTIIDQLSEMGMSKNSLLLGIGGGAVTDFTGFVASIYKRGIPFGFVPTTFLAAVDAAIGGKNGLHNGSFTDVIGTVNQPDWILYDYQFFTTLPKEEFANGFAEVIKFACICDLELFRYLEEYDLDYFRKSPVALQMIIHKCILLKSKIVTKDPLDQSIRKTLNFGSTLGSMLQKEFNIKYGFAASIGIVLESQLSKARIGLQQVEVNRIVKLLQKYHLPVTVSSPSTSIQDLLSENKKKKEDTMEFVLLQSIGEATMMKVALRDVKRDLKSYFIMRSKK
jgi:3-dehydroquinate synthase